MAGGVFDVPISVTLPVSLPQASRLCQWGVCVCPHLSVTLVQASRLRQWGVCVCVCVPIC